MFDTTTIGRPGLFGKVYNSIFGASPSPLNTEVVAGDQDSITEYNTYLNSESRFPDEPANLDGYDTIGSRRSSVIAPPMTPSRADDDWRINDTLNRIKMSRARWQQADPVPGEFPREAEPKVAGGLANKIEKNNELISQLISEFDLVTDNVELRQLRSDNYELDQKYRKLRDEFKRELDANKEIFDGYYDLHNKYNAIKQELSQVKHDASDKMSELELENQRLRQSLRAKRVDSDDQNLYYKSQYEEMKTELQAKIYQEKQYQQRIQELEKQLQSPVQSPPSSPTMHNYTRSNILDQDSIQLLRERYADKVISVPQVDSWISEPRIRKAA
ncbi:hypothetical protein OGAPHI_000471 [Ogataea philodendri]|uniref:Spindle pole body component Bbp1 C-terminal domain-containing protein n=1 Tax=Ogataea philodendri TaxID=1378263 RepID=A0A9P8PFB8_9ASCO|nr:uncharacterized protein OGAPHI_000471 [Ogataea philodendri]KAH3671248.1 hypothetical protein OGAPHI_000471 [Ogataea philodendri]